jgi:hypothetical protein
MISGICGTTALPNALRPVDEWEDWWEAEDDPIGPDDPDDYMSEADE